MTRLKRPVAAIAFLLVSTLIVAGETFRAGEKIVFVIPLEKQEISWIKSSGLSGYKEAQVAIAVPASFDPEKSYPILVTCVTGDRYLSNIDEMDKYWPQAIARDWVVVTGWSPPHPERDTKLYRRAVTIAAMRFLAEQIPSSRNWPVAVGGFFRWIQKLSHYRGIPAKGRIPHYRPFHGWL